MFPLLAILICVLELSFPHLYGIESVEAYYALWQVQMVLLCAAAIFAENTQRDKSVLTVLMLWQSWLLVSDVFLIASPIPGSLEASAFTALLLWALVRPYFFTSNTRSERTVCIAFYHGQNAPFLSSVSALFGLPFSSVAIIAGVTALRASRCGKMVLSDARALTSGGDFVFVDTGIDGSPAVIKAISDCVGKPTKVLGVFRTKCVANLMPVLKEIGYTPKSRLRFIPTFFYSQCVRQANG